MNPSALLAALLPLLSSSAFADPPKKLDLSGLLGGPSPDGPSMNNSGGSGPEKAIVLAAIAEFTDQEASVAMKTFQPMFGSITTPDGKTVAFGEQQLKDAGKLLTQMISSGKIAITPVQGHAAGAWTPDIQDKALIGGTFEVGDWKSVKNAGRDSHNFNELFHQDQFANTMLHETAHMFYSVFTIAYGFTPVSQPPVVEEFRSYFFWNSHRPISLCKSDGECPYPHAKGPCRGDDCYYWKITKDGYGAGNATEFAARTISQEMCDVGGCAAYGRVLAPAFSN